MCRMVVFAGSCTRCGESQSWDELSQQLWCLEAKNNGIFGDCTKGVYAEQHGFDQECDRCSEEDEGVGDVGDDDIYAISGKRGADVDEATRRDRKKLKT